MHRTYELYVRHRGGHVAFEALTHNGTPAELIAHVRGLLTDREAEAIEVRMAGDHLFTLAASER